MADESCIGIGSALSQQVFAVLESTIGTLEKPTPESYILPSGRATSSQSRPYSDSTQLTDGLDTINQTAGALDPADFSVAMVMRLTSAAAKPQGEDLLVSTFGSVDTSISGKRTYKLTKCRNPFSLWILNDHTVSFVEGCYVETLSMEVATEGETILTFSGRGRRQGTVGNGYLATAPTSASITLESGESKRFSVGGWVTNLSKKDGAEFKITAVDYAADTLLLDSAPTDWAAGEKIGPWLPSASAIGKELENRSIKIMADNKETGLRSSTLTFNLPVQFAQLVGLDYPDKAAPNKRTGTIGLGVYFNEEDAGIFNETLQGREIPIKITASNASGSMEIDLPRVRQQSVSIGEDDALLTLDSEGAILGNGYDSISLIIKAA